MTTDISNINIHQAVAQWVDDETAAIVTYGQIENWDGGSDGYNRIANWDFIKNYTPKLIVSTIFQSG